jgi:hypothetical protein
MWPIWGTVEIHTGFWWGKWRERDHLQDMRIDRRMILERIFKKISWEGVYWDDLAQGRDRW